MYTDIGALIAERRREKGMNQAELAAALCEEYEIDAATAKNDVDEILAQFRELEII